jgi:hypothetical protein
MRRRWGVVGLVTVLGCATSLNGRRDDGGRPRDVVATETLVATDCVDGAACAERDVAPTCDIPARPDARPSVACSALVGDRSAALHSIGAGNLTALVWNGSDYAFTWSALESSSPVLFGLYFGRADRDGELIPGSVHRIFASDRHQTRGALAVGADGYGLAWLDLPSDGLTAGMRAHFARLDSDGALIAGSERLLSTQHPPHLAVAIAYSAPLRQWAVAWQGQVALGGGNVESHAYLSRIDASCAIVEPNAALLDALRSTTDPDFAPSLVWARDRYAIVLSEYVAIPNARVSIAEIDPTTAAVTRRIVLREGGRPLRATLATDGTMYGAAWMQLGLDAPTSNAVWFRRAAVGGDAVGEAVALADGRDSGEPAVLFDGDTFRVAFNHGEARAGGVWRARFSRDGAVVGTPGLRFAGTPPFSAFPLLASDGCNDAIGWTAISGSGGQSATVRLHLRAIAAD